MKDPVASQQRVVTCRSSCLLVQLHSPSTPPHAPFRLASTCWHRGTPTTLNPSHLANTHWVTICAAAVTSAATSSVEMHAR